MNIDCRIQTLDFTVERFCIDDKKYDPGSENAQSTKFTPQIKPSNDFKDHLIHIYVETLVFKGGKSCEIKTVSTFSLHFPMPYRIFNHFTTDFVINIFSQLFLYSNGQTHGVFRERTKGTEFETFILPTRFAESLGLVTKDVLQSLH